MASKGRMIFSLLMAVAGAAGVGTFISAQKQAAYDPIVTGSNRPDLRAQSTPTVRSVKARDTGTPSPDEVKAFFDSHAKQVRNR
jgi:hypothetical protein